MPDTRTPRARRFPGDPPAPREAPRGAPALDREVVEWLERLAPEPAPKPGADAGALWHAHGARSIAIKARAEYNAQQETE